jgi:WD40 repeat protein
MQDPSEIPALREPAADAARPRRPVHGGWAWRTGLAAAAVGLLVGYLAAPYAGRGAATRLADAREQLAWSEGRRELDRDRPLRALIHLDQIPPDRRRLEWRLAAARAEPSGEPFASHASDVEAVAFSDDGGWLASGGKDVVVRDTGSLAIRHRLAIPKEWYRVTGLAFSPDGKMLAAAGEAVTTDREAYAATPKVQLWSVETGAPMTAITDGDLVNTLAFAPDGTELLLATGEIVSTAINGQPVIKPAAAVATFSLPDGRLKIRRELPESAPAAWWAERGSAVLVHTENTGWGKGELLLLDRDALEPQEFSLKRPDLASGASLTTPRLAVDARAALVASIDGTNVWILPLGSDREPVALDLDEATDAVQAIGFAAEPAVAVVATKWHLLARSLADGSPLGRSGRQFAPIESLAVCPATGRIATGHANGCVTLWSLANLAPGQRRLQTGEARLATLSADGRSWIGVREGRIVVADAASGEIRADHDILGIKAVPGTTSRPGFPSVRAVSVAADGRTAAVAATTDLAVISETDTERTIGPVVTIGLMDLETGAVARVLGERKNVVHSVAISPDARRVAVAEPEVVEIFDAASGQRVSAHVLADSSGEPATADRVVILPDGVTLVAATFNGIWRGPIDDWASATMAKPTGASSTIRCLCASPDGALVASGDGGGRIVIWDVPTLEPRHSLYTGDDGMFDDDIDQLIFADGGQRLVSVNSPGTLVVWDVATGAELFREEIGAVPSDSGWSIGGFSGSPLVLADGSLAVGTQAGPVILGRRTERSRSIVAPWPVGRLGFARLSSLLVAEALDRKREGRRPRRSAWQLPEATRYERDVSNLDMVHDSWTGLSDGVRATSPDGRWSAIVSPESRVIQLLRE